MPQRVVRFVALAAVGVLLVAGCSDGDVAAPSSTVSPSPTASSTPTAEVPDIPMPKRPPDEHTSDGAVAFTEYAVEVINRAYLTGDTESMLAIATPDCETCQQAAGDIDEVYGEGHRFEGGQITLRSIGGVAMGEGVKPTAPSVVDISEMREIGPDGATVATTPPDEALELLWDLSWDGSWHLTGVRGEAQ